MHWEYPDDSVIILKFILKVADDEGNVQKAHFWC